MKTINTRFPFGMCDVKSRETQVDEKGHAGHIATVTTYVGGNMVK